MEGIFKGRKERKTRKPRRRRVLMVDHRWKRLIHRWHRVDPVDTNEQNVWQEQIDNLVGERRHFHRSDRMRETNCDQSIFDKHCRRNSNEYHCIDHSIERDNKEHTNIEKMEMSHWEVHLSFDHRLFHWEYSIDCQHWRDILAKLDMPYSRPTRQRPFFRRWKHRSKRIVLAKIGVKGINWS